MVDNTFDRGTEISPITAQRAIDGRGVNGTSKQLLSITKHVVPSTSDIYTQNDALLQALTRRFQSIEISPDVRTRNAIREMWAFEQSFRRSMERQPIFRFGEYRTRLLSERDRPNMLRIFDNAYDHAGSNWDYVRRNYMIGFYQDPESRSMIQRGINSGLIGAMTEEDFRQGNVFSVRSPRNPTSYERINIDHSLPRERQPFLSYSRQNLHFTTAHENQRILNSISRASPFPMGMSYGQIEDEIEIFVQSNQLSRRQRPAPERRRRSRVISILTIISTIFLIEITRSAFAQLATTLRENRRRRQSRMLPREDEVDIINFGSWFDMLYILPHSRSSQETIEILILDFNTPLATALQRATQNLFNRHNNNSLYEQRIESQSRIDPQFLGARLMPELIDQLLVIRRIIDRINNLLAYYETTEVLRNQLSEMREYSEGLLEDQLQSLGPAALIVLSDAEIIYSELRRGASLYESYFLTLRRFLLIFQQMLRINESRRRNLEPRIQRENNAIRHR